MIIIDIRDNQYKITKIKAKEKALLELELEVQRNGGEFRS